MRPTRRTATARASSGCRRILVCRRVVRLGSFCCPPVSLRPPRGCRRVAPPVLSAGGRCFVNNCARSAAAGRWQHRARARLLAARVAHGGAHLEVVSQWWCQPWYQRCNMATGHIWRSAAAMGIRRANLGARVSRCNGYSRKGSRYSRAANCCVARVAVDIILIWVDLFDRSAARTASSTSRTRDLMCSARL